MKKVIVTGGLGFIGSNFINLLLNRGYFVINVDKVSYSSNENIFNKKTKNYVFIKNNLFNSDKNFRILKKFKPIAIFNFAAESHVDRSIDNPDIFVENNFLSTLKLVEAVRKYLKIKKNKKFKFIQISTDEVYGDSVNKKIKTKENDPYEPSSPYASSKASGDLLIKSYVKTFKFPGIITNSCNNFGKFQNVEKFIPTVILSILKKRNIPIYGNGLQKREWIFVEDHSEALIYILKKGKAGESYNIGSGVVKSNLEVANKIKNYFSKKYFYNKKISKIKKVIDRPGHDRLYNLNSTKIKSLGWKIKSNFDNKLKCTVDWYVNNALKFFSKKSLNLKRLGNLK